MFPKMRAWLNPSNYSEYGYVVWDFTEEGGDDIIGTDRGSILRIADCNRIVSLDFYYWDKKSAANRLRKFNNLEKLIHAFCEYGRNQIYSIYPDLKDNN